MKDHCQLARLASLVVLSLVIVVAMTTPSSATGNIVKADLSGAWQMTIIGQTGIVSERIRRLTRRQMLKSLLFGVALFFLVMSVMDPVVQLGVQRLGWSTGLIIEVGFFIPAGIVLLILSRGLRS